MPMLRRWTEWLATIHLLKAVNKKRRRGLHYPTLTNVRQTDLNTDPCPLFISMSTIKNILIPGSQSCIIFEIRRNTQKWFSNLGIKPISGRSSITHSRYHCRFLVSILFRCNIYAISKETDAKSVHKVTIECYFFLFRFPRTPVVELRFRCFCFKHTS